MQPEVLLDQCLHHLKWSIMLHFQNSLFPQRIGLNNLCVTSTQPFLFLCTDLGHNPDDVSIRCLCVNGCV